MRGHGRRGPLAAATLAGLFALGFAGTATADFTQEPGSPFAVNAVDPQTVFAVDFNADGRTDVATLNGTSSNTSVLLRQPSGGFLAENGSPFSNGCVACGPSAGILTDMNGDGRPDIVVPQFISGQITVLLRDGGGGFDLEADPPFDAGPRASSVGAGDFNGDGRVDLAVGQYDTGLVAILQRNATGPGDDFTVVSTVATGSNPRSIAVADFNADGDLDLAVANEALAAANGTVTILLGGAGFAFAPEGASIPVGGRPQQSLAHDLNGDGRPDLAVPNATSDSVTILQRQAGGGFAASATLPVGDVPVGLAIGDFNSDALLDIAAANQGSSNVSVLLRTAAGGYTPDTGSPVPTDEGATSVAVADFNADARPDMAVANLFEDTVTILLNSTPRPIQMTPGGGGGGGGTTDADRDGVSPPLDCRDTDPAIRPGVRDRPGDGIDQDCNGRDAPLPVLSRALVGLWATYPSGYTKFTEMTISPVRRGDRVRLTCRGRGCTKRTATVRVRKNQRKLSMLRHIGSARLRRGATVELRVTRPGTIGRVSRWEIRAPQIPKLTRRCVRPGSRRLARCP
jgi:FG-GAP-like repeat/Putative metal-binding motif/FG-GAP repeat